MNTPEKILTKLSLVGGCHEWTGCKNAKGYGTARWRGRVTLVHRIVWEIHNGPIPDGLCVLHKCDNPPCASADHLYVGTKKDNSLDCKNRGRMPLVSGENHPNAKLNWEQVTEIRNAYSNGGCTNHSLAEKYGVGDTVINLIVNKKIWVPSAPN